MSQFKGIAAVFAAAASWGMSGIFVTKFIEASKCSSVSLAFWRDFTVFLVLLLLSFPQIVSGKEKKKKKDLPWLIGMGLKLFLQVPMPGFCLEKGLILSGSAELLLSCPGWHGFHIVRARQADLHWMIW